MFLKKLKILILLVRNKSACLTCPQFFIEPAHIFSNLLTVMSMAALGLGVDVRSVARAGYRVTAVVVLSLVTLFVISFVLIKLLGLN